MDLDDSAQVHLLTRKELGCLKALEDPAGAHVREVCHAD